MKPICSFCGHKHTQESKAKISAGRKLWLQQNPDKHPWKRSSKFRSIPCEKLKHHLQSKGISFVEEYMPLEDKNYSIDIAFPDIKLGIEVNGNQHYQRDGTLQLYYQQRHDEIESTGWTLIELHYSTCFMPAMIDSMITIKKTPDYGDYIKKNLERRDRVKTRQTISHRTRRQYQDSVREQTNKKYEPIINRIINGESGIDFQKFGWVNEAADLIGVSSSKVCKWMTRHMPDFYKTCKKRKSALLYEPPTE